jgi:hypothetical protein
MPHHFDNGTVVIGNAKFRRPRRARLCERHIRHEPKRAPALPERRVTGLASYEINRRSARRKCTGRARPRPRRTCQTRQRMRRLNLPKPSSATLWSERRRAASWNEPWSIACSEPFPGRLSWQSGATLGCYTCNPVVQESLILRGFLEAALRWRREGGSLTPCCGHRRSEPPEHHYQAGFPSRFIDLSRHPAICGRGFDERVSASYLLARP